ncbi:hypothetical protein UAJ10_12525 [Nitrospirillum sp. BR 11164]|uniref:hypothetical protein n=1 Tax=Nitrospirillum sp. BR 11164 TaxID=3104324 RepID=UPI002B001571|nr:hypothetical protein [Nitrospirillum sp. BR 11164]MEA1649837.1 hypothetical protein [Nitrospirillum sp. BR 11164]
MRRLFVALVLGLLVVAPAGVGVRSAWAQSGGFGFADETPITLNVAEIEVVNDYVSPMKPPNIEYQLQLTPAEVVRLWVQDRLKAAGSSGKARVVIKNASIVEVNLPRTTGVKGWFTTDQSQRYDGRVEVEIQVDMPAKGYAGSTSVVVTSSQSVSEDVTLNQREKTWSQLVRDMARDMDAQLAKGIRDNLFAAMIL